MKQISVAELQALCASGARSAPWLLDLREPWEAQLASIRIAGVADKLLPMGQVPERLDELDPLQPVIVYCHHGMRSMQVVAFLQRQGFETVYNLAGGIDAWSQEADRAVPRY